MSKLRMLGPNIPLNPDASPAALRAVRSAPVSLVRYMATPPFWN